MFVLNYWYTLNKLSTRFFLVTGKKQNQFIGIAKNKYQRVSSSKKIVIKNKSTSLLVVLQLQLSSTLITNTPPLNNLLNLYGINVQKFCDEISTELKNFPIFEVPFSLKIFILKDLSFKYILYKFKSHNLIKNFFYNYNKFDLVNLSLNVFVRNQIFAKRNLLGNFESLRNYYFIDMFLFINFIFLFQHKLIYYNNYYNKSIYADSFALFFLTKENYFNNYIAVLKSFNIYFKIIKIQ